MSTREIPENAWLRREGEIVVLGAVLRDAILHNWIAALLFLCF